MSDSQSAPRVVVLGIDAGDPDLLEQFMRAGQLPALAKLVARGRYARTTGPELLCEHGVWVSILSGISRRSHGFHFFRQLRSGSYDITLARGVDLDVRPFWCHLSPEARVLIVDAPDIPPQPDVHGRHLAEWATHSHYPPIPLRAHPTSLLADAQALSGDREVIAEELGATVDRDREIIARLLARVARKGALIRGLMRAEPADLVVSVFAESHTGAHQSWEYRRNAKGNGTRESVDLGDALLQLYQSIDREIGLIVQALPPATTVFVLGSVGLRSQYPTEELALNVCRALGYQRDASSKGARSFNAMALVRRVLPQSVRTFLSRGLSLDRQAQFESEKFQAATDWSQTRAFALPGYYSSAIRINLRGREPQGTVNPSDLSALCEEIRRNFMSLIDADTQQPVVERVVMLYDPSAYGADAHADLPDLLVVWREHDRPIRAVRWVSPHGEQIDITQSRHPFYRGSDHADEGFVIAAGGAIRADDSTAASSGVSPLSVAPTVLRAMGAPVPASMTTPPLDWV